MSRPARPRLWRTLTLAGTAAGLAAAGAVRADTGYLEPGAPKVMLAQAQGGEAGESGAVKAEDPKIRLVTDVTLIDGHLRAGLALYREGRVDAAKTHMKHPEDEIYTSLVPLLKEFGVPGFGDELAALAAIVEAGKPADEADAAFDTLRQKLDAARAVAKDDPYDTFAAMTDVMKQAAKEYDAGTKNGEVTDAHEYQDAWGFIEAVQAQAEAISVSGSGSDVRNAADDVMSALGDTAAAFDGLAPEGNFGADPQAIYGAAARVEFAANSLK